MTVHSHKPREAITQFLVLHRFRAERIPATLLRARPETGRTHQIRVHLASSGHPCLGDSVYGNSNDPACEGKWEPGRHALHALCLSVKHPRSGLGLEFIAPLPDDIAGFLSAAGVEIGPSMIREWIEAD